MDTLIKDTNSTIKNHILNIFLFAFLFTLCMYYTYYTTSQLECSIYSICAIFHAKNIFNSLNWINFMKNQKRWIEEFKTTYPVPAPKPVSLKSLWNSLSSVVW